MPFRFVYICDLLDLLEKPFLRDVPILSRHLHAHNQRHIINWFKQHKANLDSLNTSAGIVLSIFQPEKQTDRVYGLDMETLERIVARVLGLSREQYLDLQKWRHGPKNGDLAVCVNRVIDRLPNDTLRSLTNAINVEEVDQALLRIASFNEISSAEVRSLSKSCKWGYADEVLLLGNLYQRLHGREAKWLTRLILKSYAPVKFPDDLTFGSKHSYLPSCLSVSIHFPTPESTAVRMEGTSIIKGVRSAPSASVLTFYSTAPQSTPSSSNIRRGGRPQSPPTSARRPVSVSYQLIPALSGPDVGISSQRLRTPARPALVQISQNSQRQITQLSLRSTKPGSIHARPALKPCRFASDSCHFRNRIFILSPCISSIPYITTELLPAHGAYFVTSLSALSSPSLPRRCPSTGKRYRKVLLVESRNTERTVQCVQKVMRLGLKRRNGKPELVEVYDWRLLECIVKVDSGKKLDYDPWKRCWMLSV